jgi:hypothetical protein
MDRGSRSARARADYASECYILPADAFHALGKSHPEAKIVLLENILRGAYRMVSRLNQISSRTS